MHALTFLAVLLAGFNSRTQAQLVPQKTQYTIGGSTADAPDVFLKKFQPLFEDYLNSAVGSKYSPNISFKLVTVDYTPSTRAQEMVSTGNIDFVCMIFFLFLIIVSIAALYFDNYRYPAYAACLS